MVWPFPPPACPLSVIAIHVALEASLAQEEPYKDYKHQASIKLLDKLKSVKLNTPEIRLNKPHVVSAVISCHLPGYLTGADRLSNTRVFDGKYPGIWWKIPGYLSIKPGYWKIPGYFSSNTRVFSSTPVIWRCTGYMTVYRCILHSQARSSWLQCCDGISSRLHRKVKVHVYSKRSIAIAV